MYTHTHIHTFTSLLCSIPLFNYSMTDPPAVKTILIEGISTETEQKERKGFVCVVRMIAVHVHLCQHVYMLGVQASFSW